MNKLENGALVYNKDYGQGIVINSFTHNNEVLFANNINSAFIERDELFTDGDRVYYSESNLTICKKENIGFFRGFVPFFNPDSNCLYLSHNKDSYPFAVRDIVHVEEEPNIEITVKINGKDVRLSSLSEETLLKIRENS